jgi:hypothetical protein
MKLAILSFLLAAACLLGGCDPRQTSRDLEVAHGDIKSPLLYVWAGDEDLNEGDTDFLAVIDSDPKSATYGNVITTTPIGVAGTNPHHAEPVAPRGALLFANGYNSGRTFLFDLSNPRSPELKGELEQLDNFNSPHSFLRLDDGTLLATLQYGDGTEVGNPGGLARFDSAAVLIDIASAKDPDVEGEVIRPYAVEAIPELDRVVTTGRTMNIFTEQAADIVQIWSLSDLNLLKTLRIPRVAAVASPECVLGVGAICDAEQYPAEAQPFESRVMSDGSVLMNTLMCGLYRISNIDTEEPNIELVLNYPELVGCSVPAVIEHYYILPVLAGETVIVLDMSNPGDIKEVSRFATPGYQPHWAAADPKKPRVVVTSSGPSPTNTVLMLDFNVETGELSLDERFGSKEFPRAGLSFYRESWPHGETGTAIPHAAFFGSN